MMPRRPFLPLAASLLTLTLAGCGKEQPAAPAPAADPALVTPATRLLSRLKIAPVATASFTETLRVPGRIDFDEKQLARIGATVTGRITDISAQVGQIVRKGTPLASINSSELSQAQLAYLKARAELELHRRAAERARLLFDSDVIGAAELQRRESEFQVTTAEARAAADQLRLLGLSAGALDRLGRLGAVVPVSPVYSSISGVVVERTVTQGQVVQPADSLFTVADLSRVWAVAEVPERQASAVRSGQQVMIEVPALNNAVLVGKLIFVSQTLAPDTRTVLVRTELENADGRLKPGMLASMLIAAEAETRLVVPSSAVVRENNRDHVYVALADNRFRLTPVTLGPEHDKTRPVLSGLQEGLRVVTEGGFHLNNERNRQALEGS